MYERTILVTPPEHELLAVVHNFGSGQIDDEATWTGHEWIRKYDGERMHKTYYSLWRRLKTP